MKIPAIPGFDQQAFEKYFKNTGWLMIGRVGSLIIKMLVGFAVANYLGKGQNGVLNYANSFVLVFLAVAGLGLDSFIVRELVKAPDEQHHILGTSFFLKLIGAIGTVPLILLTYFIFPDENTPVLYVFILSFIGLFQSFTVIDAYFQSRVQAKYIMQVNVAGNLISALIKVILIWLKMPLIFFVIALLADAAILALGYVLIYGTKQLKIRRWRVKPDLAKFLLLQSWPLMFSSVLITIYMKIDQVMIGRILGTDALGIYSTVVPLSEAWAFIPMSIVASVFPAIINAKRESEQRYLRRLQNLYDLMAALSLAIAIFMTFTSGLIYHVYKPEYAYGAAVLKVHIWSGLFIFLGVANSQYLVNEGYTKISLLKTAVGAIVNILLNLILLPKMGIIGAAWATLIAYGVSVFFVLLPRHTREQGILMLRALFFISLIKRLSEAKDND